jgi:hypothetical protein
MQTIKILASLLLCISVALPQYTQAASFCSKTPEGLIRVDDCNYSSNEECKRATGNDCVASDEEVPSKVAPYCMVTWSTSCTYFNYEACTKAALKLRGYCYANPDYKDPDKQ